MIQNSRNFPYEIRTAHPAYLNMEEHWEYTVKDKWVYHVYFTGHCRNVSGKGIEFIFQIPDRDIMYRWHPVCGCDRTLRADWDEDLHTMNAVSAPVISMINGSDENRFTLALSETQKTIHMNAGVHEEDGTILFSACIDAGELEEVDSYSIALYLNQEKSPVWKAVDDVRFWWEKTMGLVPLGVPDTARYPMYSTWYSFHQEIADRSLEEEAQRAKELGFSTIIVDDGWQTDDNNRGYAYCGDWEPALEKFPSMKEHVERIHQLDMKFMIWFSVPFIGIHAKRWEEFSDKLIYFDKSRQAGVLDIRFPEIRQYLLQFYVRAVKEWKVDGLKLDFIDEFFFRSGCIERTGISCRSIQEALDSLLQEVTAELKKYNPDIMIEFRQRYIGPGIRRYGNIYRVADCPESALTNRIGSVDLRMLSGSTAVHSDMIMWNERELPEDIAIQLQNAAFATPQISVRLDRLSEEQKEVLKFWIKFCKENMELLQQSQIMPTEAGHLYPVVRTELRGEEIIAVYGPDRVISLNENLRKHTIIWANKSPAAYVLMKQKNARNICRYDCRGHVLENVEEKKGGCRAVPMTAGGLLVISEQ